MIRQNNKAKWETLMEVKSKKLQEYRSTEKYKL